MPNSPKTILILSISSDIGLFLAQQYLDLGHHVIGTYRSSSKLDDLRGNKNCHLFCCDVHDHESIQSFARELKALDKPWDTFISCVGHPLPLGAFFETNFDEWQASVEVNCLDQLRAVHVLYPYRNANAIANVAFFAAGGANNAVVNFSPYTISKIMLTKMCEFLDAENQNLNVFIVGPGWTNTKIHQLILNDPSISKEKYEQTKVALESGEGTSLKDIFECIEWLCQQGRSIAGGRNFSVVHDPWRLNEREALMKELSADSGMYKLRRHKNDFLQP